MGELVEGWRICNKSVFRVREEKRSQTLSISLPRGECCNLGTARRLTIRWRFVRYAVVSEPLLVSHFPFTQGARSVQSS